MKQGNHPDADGQFNNSLYWYWNDGKLNFDNNWANNANHNFGSAVGRFSLRLFSLVQELGGFSELLPT